MESLRNPYAAEAAAEELVAEALLLAGDMNVAGLLNSVGVIKLAAVKLLACEVEGALADNVEAVVAATVGLQAEHPAAEEVLCEEGRNGE